MKERPILFSAPMVRATLSGQKTQTRRIVKPQPPVETVIVGTYHHPDPRPHFWACDAHSLLDWAKPCPYGQTGDLLWVRETWGVGSRPDQWGGYDGIEYRADEAWLEGDDLLPCHKVQTPDDVFLCDYRSGWHPSIHMPRWASRITLEVTGVRVERLQEISEADAQAEGAKCVDRASGREVLFPDESQHIGSWKLHFREIWESINGPGSWDLNPWVWVVEFRRILA